MNIIDNILSIIAPENCIVCGTEGRVICYPCLIETESLPSVCYICLRATADNIPCQKHATKYSPQHVWQLYSYTGSIKQLLWKYKFEQKRSACVMMAKVFDEQLPYLDQCVVTWVPTDPRRLRQRGFDHAKLLAIELAKKRNLTYCDLLKRNRHSMQHGLTREQRLQNINGLYSADQRSNGQKILLVDDIITTGATISECSRQLHKAGASSVDVVSFARTPK